MLELNVLDALVTAGQSLVLASLIYFLFLVVRYGDLFHHAGHEGDTRPLREAACGARMAVCGEPEHGTPGNVLDEIAAGAARMARAAN